MAPTLKELEYLLHHVVLPPKLPQQDDYEAAHERFLVESSRSALQDVKKYVKNEHCEIVENAVSTLTNLLSARDVFGHVNETELKKLLAALVAGQLQGAIPLEIKAQNAGMLISRSADYAVFEFFELSPTNAAAMLKGRLIRTFPALAVQVPLSKLKAELQSTLAFTIAKMTTQAISEFQTKVKKAGQMHDEKRDTVDPSIVTDYLFSFISTFGDTIKATSIIKHTREEVLWDNALNPWRRSPLWLLTRVSLQLHFVRNSPTAQPLNELFKAFMVQLLTTALKQMVGMMDHESMHITSAKLTRRLRKMECLQYIGQLAPEWCALVQDVVVGAHDHVSKHWLGLETLTNPPIDMSSLASLRPDHDLQVSLPELDLFLSSIASRHRSTLAPTFDPTVPLPVFSNKELPAFDHRDDEVKYFRLAALEEWVEQHLETWLASHTADTNACSSIVALMKNYFEAAQDAYSGMPLSLSVMYLTIVELWIACDTSALAIHPLLASYDPEVVLDELQCLLLPFTSQMKRLHVVEEYIRLRRKNSGKGNSSIFRNFGDQSSLAVAYFNQSTEMQTLKSRIEEKATTDRQKKQQELIKLQQEYRDLMDRFARSECEEEMVVINRHHGYTESRHKQNCFRCALRSRADAIDIEIFEWPLSPIESKAKATVFELAIPQVLSVWRDSCLWLITDVLGCEYHTSGRPERFYRLNTHQDLQHLLPSHYHSQRLHILSSIKSHSVTHRKRKAAIVHLTANDVCLRNALQYCYFDQANSTFTSAAFSSTQIVSKNCLQRMPDCTRSLERYMHKPSSNPDGVSCNEVLANVQDCPDHLSIDEWKVSGALLLGCEIMRQNILVQLATPVIDFAKVESQCLILQSLQAGPPHHGIARVTHAILEDEDFTSTMLDYLTLMLDRHAKSWESWRALASMTIICRRILTFAKSPQFIDRCLQILVDVRVVCMSWIHLLRKRAFSCAEDSQRTGLLSRATEIALLSISTFDVDNAFIDRVLEPDNAVSELVQSSIIVQENQNTASTDSKSIYRTMLQSWRLLSYKIFQRLRNRILRDGKGLCDAISQNWNAFSVPDMLSNPWKLVKEPYDQWVFIKSGELPVHYNLLTAQLLVNGLPLARLPSIYERHSMYARLFQSTILEVVPTNEAAMSFSAKSKYQDHQLHFGLDGNGNLLLLAIKDGQRFDLLPADVFANSLPWSFRNSFVHWFDHAREEVIFRPRSDPWLAPERTCWRMRSSFSRWILYQDSKDLVNNQSLSARPLLRALSPLEDAMHIHVVYDHKTQVTHISLPRLETNFYFERGSPWLFSRQYRGLAVDEDQIIGTLIGLSSRLVLKSVDEPKRRVVLIPSPHNFGASAACSSKHQHVLVAIPRHVACKIYAYPIDSTLGRMLDSGDLQSRLWRCYLHALTSHFLPDPLLGDTGTETAIKVLRSAATLSFDTLGEEAVYLLEEISKLSPRRNFYPAYERVMQQIEWRKLPSLSQHPLLRTCVKAVLSHAQRMLLFFPGKTLPVRERNASSAFLESRDALRASTFRLRGFGAESFDKQYDSVYAARDIKNPSARSQRALTASKLIDRDNFALSSPLLTFKEELMKGPFSNATVNGIGSSGPVHLKYDSAWLMDSNDLIRSHWCTLHAMLTNPAKLAAAGYTKFDIMAWLSVFAYSATANTNIIQALAALFRVPQPLLDCPPPVHTFNLSCGDHWETFVVQKAVRQMACCFEYSREAREPKKPLETNRQHKSRIREMFACRVDNAIHQYVAALEEQWPCLKPRLPKSNDFDTYLDVTKGQTTIEALFLNWYNNRLFSGYLTKVSHFMASQNVWAVEAVPRSGSTHVDIATVNTVMLFNTDEIFETSHAEGTAMAPCTICAPSEPNVAITLQQDISSMVEDLGLLCRKLENLARSSFEKKYVRALRDSRTFLHHNADQRHTAQQPLGEQVAEVFQIHMEECEAYVSRMSGILEQAFTKSISPIQNLAVKVRHSGGMPPHFWLGHLRVDRYERLSQPWRTAIIQYGIAITVLHRAQRLFALRGNPVELSEELSHVGHTNWSPENFPETLLLEIESSIMIRATQEVIAANMRSPDRGSNIVLQLLMGGGKSSTIVPILAAHFSDTKQLARVIVLKPQSQQMLHMLVDKLGGLLARRVYLMPFSRNLELTSSNAEIIHTMIKECIVERGILLVLPEHVLSFKLMGLERLLDDDPAAPSLLKTQELLEDTARDIVDESDDAFSPKFELIYTIGTQNNIQYAPERWLIIQEVLGLIPRFALEVQREDSLAIDIQNEESGRYPRIRLLTDAAGTHLLALIADHIIKAGIPQLPIRNQDKQTQDAVLRYISKFDLDTEDIRAVEESRFYTESTKDPILLLRGLLAGGVLRFVFGSKRWRVNFGLDPHRIPKTSLAVPYRSKDSPSPRSEFSHPDVVIVLTLLSKYYGGLEDGECFDALHHLRKTDQAHIKYDEWVQTAAPSLPKAFRQISGISLSDEHQCREEVIPHLRYSRKAIDYYLSALVFPKEIKEFPKKLSSSGWDLGATKRHPLVGFSGTNDASHLLPLSVRHLDLETQAHTNALVLGFLLQPETKVELLPVRRHETDAEQLLKTVKCMEPEVRVLLDCGAFVLEHNNHQVVEMWLELCEEEVQAAVFFLGEELSVLDRNGRVEPFQTSPFAKQLDVCIVFLDEAHTRGTDLKLPRHYRAAATLGAFLTKDRLTQACMRLRQLGKGQSVAFVVPPEIATKIRNRRSKPFDASIDVPDVLAWSIQETWDELKRNTPLWAVQGHRYERHMPLLMNGHQITQEQVIGVLEEEAQNLETRYRPRMRDGLHGINREWDQNNDNIQRIIQRCKEIDTIPFESAALSEEQERELAPEIEQEQQNERPPRMQAAQSCIHPDLIRLACTGLVIKRSTAFKSAFHALNDTSAVSVANLSQWPTELLVTADFVRTVQPPRGLIGPSFKSDLYQRSVQFVLSVGSKDHVPNLVIISPHEANGLIASIRRNKAVTMHLFSPRVNIRYLSLDRLELFNIGRAFNPSSVPRNLTVQLNLFSGSLYLRSVEEYKELCDFLGLLSTELKPSQGVFADGFIDPPCGKWGLTTSPVPFLRILLMKIRREGGGLEKTHLGKILSGVMLEDGDFVKECADEETKDSE